MATPNLALIRKALFWDADINKIDWNKQYKTVIQRVFERGNEEGRLKSKRFYGDVVIDKALTKNKRETYTIYKNKSFED